MKPKNPLYVVNAAAMKYLRTIAPVGKTGKQLRKIPNPPGFESSDLLFGKQYGKQPLNVEVGVPLATINQIRPIPIQRTIDQSRKNHVIGYLSGDGYCDQTANVVVSAILPNGKEYLIDGNTRVAVWQDERIKAVETGVPSEINIPTFINKIVYPVKDMAAMELLYYTFDNKNAVETVKDKLGGAMESLSLEDKSFALPFKNTIIQRRNWKRMMQAVAKEVPETLQDDVSEERALIRMFHPELAIINARATFGNALGGEAVGQMSAMLYRARGNTSEQRNIMDFWNKVGNRTGDFTENGMKNGVAHLQAEYDKSNTKRRYQHKSTHRLHMFGLQDYYYNLQKNGQLTKKKCGFTDTALNNVLSRYFK